MGRSTTMKLSGLGLVLTCGALAACAASGGGGGGDGSGGGNGGGLVDGTGGAAQGTGGGDQNPIPGSGGDNQNPGSGGTNQNPGSGGDNQNPGSGGTTAATGGTSGGGMVECTGTSFEPANGFYDNGTFCGYGFTYAFDDGGTVEPPMNFMMVDSGLCISGSVGAADNDAGTYPGIALGVNVAQNSMGTEASYTTSGTGLSVTYTAGGATNLRAQIQAGGVDYCYDMAGSGSEQIPWSSFQTNCWETGTAFTAGTQIQAFHIQVPSGDAPQTISNLCLTGLNQY